MQLHFALRKEFDKLLYTVSNNSRFY